MASLKKKKFTFFTLRESEKAEGGVEGEGESQADSPLNTEPPAGFNLRTLNPNQESNAPSTEPPGRPEG